MDSIERIENAPEIFICRRARTVAMVYGQGMEMDLGDLYMATSIRLLAAVAW